MSNICYSETCNSPSLRSSCHTPVTSPSGLCSTEVICRDAPCSPTSSLGSNTLPDSCHEHCGEHISCQSTSCKRGPSSPAGCSPIASGVSGSQEGTICLPVISRGSSFCRLPSCRQPLRSHLPSYQYYGCQPLGYLACGHQPLSCLPYNRPPLRNLTYRCQPFRCMPNYYRPTSCTYSNFQPHSFSLTGWQYPY